MKKYFILTGLLAAIALGCEKAIDIDVPIDDPKLVLNGFLNPDSSLMVHVSKSQYVLDNAPLQNIEDAKVTIYQGEELLGVLKHQEFGLYKLEGVKPETGKAYTVIAEKSGFPTAAASEKIPSYSVVSDIEVDSLGSGQHGQQKFDITFTLEDAPGKGNYYLISVMQRGFYKYYDHQYPYDPNIPEEEREYTWMEMQIPTQLTSTDPLMEEFCAGMYHNCSLLIKDDHIDGKSTRHNIIAELFFGPPSDEVKDMELLISVIHVPQSYYLYYKTYEINNEASGNPFAEPAKVFSNIEGGYGIWSAIAPFTYSVK